MKDSLQKKSKQLSYLLRHNPEELKMNKNGYVIVSELLKKLNISLVELEYIVSENDKKRFEFNNSGDMIRASQGHTLAVDVELKATRPPRTLYHGTSQDNYEKIVKGGGLDKMKRLHVHLTHDMNVAYTVGTRYSKYKKPVILSIDSAAMNTDGYTFYLSANGVWLTDTVPMKYIKKI